VVTPLVNTQPDTKLCPECGAAMQIKNGRRGKIWGCTNYPRCHHTEDWNGD
jgi:DNA topoisomerase III